jgi:hypothetical protein
MTCRTGNTKEVTQLGNGPMSRFLWEVTLSILGLQDELVVFLAPHLSTLGSEPRWFCGHGKEGWDFMAQ